MEHSNPYSSSLSSLAKIITDETIPMEPKKKKKRALVECCIFPFSLSIYIHGEVAQPQYIRNKALHSNTNAPSPFFT